jgi:hypothetical protein
MIRMGTELLSLAEVLERVPSAHRGKRLARTTLLRWIHAGLLPAVQRGRHYFVRPADLQRLYTPSTKEAELPRHRGLGLTLEVVRGLERYGILVRG